MAIEAIQVGTVPNELPRGLPLGNSLLRHKASRPEIPSRITSLFSINFFQTDRSSTSRRST